MQATEQRRGWSEAEDRFAMTEQQRHDWLAAEERANKWLADANEAGERGQTAKEERCLAKSQYWLDRANKLRGWG